MSATTPTSGSAMAKNMTDLVKPFPPSTLERSANKRRGILVRTVLINRHENNWRIKPTGGDKRVTNAL
jgi:hypothetical protein